MLWVYGQYKYIDSYSARSILESDIYRLQILYIYGFKQMLS